MTTGTVNHEGYKDVAKQLADRFGFTKVAITLRESLSANDNNWSAMLYDGTDYYFSKKYKMHIVDRVGGGDSFGGGLIYACLNGYDAQSTIEFAVAASCLKHSIEGDMNMVSVDEVTKLAGGDGPRPCSEIISLLAAHLPVRASLFLNIYLKTSRACQPRRFSRFLSLPCVCPGHVSSLRLLRLPHQAVLLQSHILFHDPKGLKAKMAGQKDRFFFIVGLQGDQHPVAL